MTACAGSVGGPRPIRLLVIDPVGVDLYGGHFAATLRPWAAPETELVVRHLPALPASLFMTNAELVEREFVDAVVAAEHDGFDGVICACASDPGVRAARGHVAIPVTGPFDALARTAPAFGPLAIIATGFRVETWAPRAESYGLTALVTGVRLANFERPAADVVEQLIGSDPVKLRGIVLDAVRRALVDEGIEQVRLAVERDGARSVFFACTYWSGMLDPVAEAVPGVVVLDPLRMALRYAEYLVATRGQGANAKESARC